MNVGAIGKTTVGKTSFHKTKVGQTGFSETRAGQKQALAEGAQSIRGAPESETSDRFTWVNKPPEAARAALPIPASVCSLSVCLNNGMAASVCDF